MLVMTYICMTLYMYVQYVLVRLIFIYLNFFVVGRQKSFIIIGLVILFHVFILSYFFKKNLSFILFKLLGKLITFCSENRTLPLPPNSTSPLLPYPFRLISSCVCCSSTYMNCTEEEPQKGGRVCVCVQSTHTYMYTYVKTHTYIYDKYPINYSRTN